MLTNEGPLCVLGTTATLSFSLSYAPPETLRTLQVGARTTTSDPAVDMWALGVIAYELLTRRRAFASDIATDEIKARILGHSPLPWETSDLRKRDVPELRMLKRTVLACLDRDQSRRPTATQVHALPPQPLRACLTTTDARTRFSSVTLCRISPQVVACHAVPSCP
jgi:serine/threonine protein kinase